MTKGFQIGRQSLTTDNHIALLLSFLIKSTEINRTGPIKKVCCNETGVRILRIKHGK